MLATSLVATNSVYGYIVPVTEVFCEHVEYDPAYYTPSESTYIYAGIFMEDMGLPANYTVEVKWDNNTRILPFQFFRPSRALFSTQLGYLPPTSFDSWENRFYTFYVNGLVVGADTITGGALRRLSTPKADYNRATKSISWEMVDFADGYVVMILNRTNVDDLRFDTGDLGPVNRYTFGTAYHDLLDLGAVLAVEAWDYTTGPFNLNNSSIYVTSSLPHPAMPWIPSLLLF